MNEQLRNIPQEAISDANKSDQMHKIKRQQFIARWGFRAGYLAGLYEVKDSIHSEFWNMITLNIHDTKTFAITELIGVLAITSRIVGYHFEKQRNALITNSINRGIKEEFPDYNPPILPEGHIDQYKDSARKFADSFRRRFKI